MLYLSVEGVCLPRFAAAHKQTVAFAIGTGDAETAGIGRYRFRITGTCGPGALNPIAAQRGVSRTK